MKYLSNSKIERNIDIYNQIIIINRNSLSRYTRGWTHLAQMYNISCDRVKEIYKQIKRRIDNGELKLNGDNTVRAPW